MEGIEWQAISNEELDRQETRYFLMKYNYGLSESHREYARMMLDSIGEEIDRR